jgi:Ca2+-binding EF-hand superfamily protein
MKHTLLLLAVALSTMALGAACSGSGRYHDTELPDPAKFNAHFGDLDNNGDGQVTPEEFQTHFPGSADSVFQVLDLNADGFVDHEEWHRFKTAHGLKHGG